MKLHYPPDLPICTRREEILAALRSHQVLVVAGETGSGKTTQLPKMCLEHGAGERGLIGCTQPRRVAAMSVSRRVAEELGVRWGAEVGCKMRFNDDTSRETRVKFMTDGILLAEVQSDPLLRRYSMIIVDEAHERSLNIDFLLGYLQTLLRKRSDLQLVITSATIDTHAFSKAFGDAPIIEVSGRLFPVEIRYASPETFMGPDDDRELCHIGAAVRATEDALIESDSGDILVFMPTERDIREARDQLEGRLGSGTEVLALYGRLAAADQQRVFAPGPRRRVVVATNVAETSLTIPRIRYVIDSGLARISRYHPRTRTKRLPVEAISQSSANQRTGRAGRLSDGICIRLYDEEDFQKRPRFTHPEILRANLAEVILRMKAYRLGEIETFPFIEPPTSASVRAGYQLLFELGAINELNELTPLGRELARLPIDPTLGRMLLQARNEHVLGEVLVIASALSVPDPRERPEEDKEAAAAAQRVFIHPDSDFLTLLNLWRAAPQADGKGSTNALRRFCKAHFLSFTRMREWRDIHSQLADALTDGENTSVQVEDGPEDIVRFASIHCSILAGLLGHIAQRLEKNAYKAGGNRQVMIFPGSGLFARREQNKQRDTPPKSRTKQEEKSRQPGWIMAGEIVETSQLFARTVAKIEPEWIMEIGAHLCEYRHGDPAWSAKAGRVLCWERVLIQGLEIARRQVDYGRVDAPAATEIFIRCAMVSEDAHLPNSFFEHNRIVREKVSTALTKVRHRQSLDIDEALYRFYAARITDVSSTHDLNRLVRSRIAEEPEFLCATEADLIGETDISYDRDQFPDTVPLGNSVLPITYNYNPGGDEDGVTVRVPLPVAEQLTDAQLQWMVPGLREERIGVLLRALPKTLRKQLMPIDPKIREIASEFEPGRGDFLRALADFLSRRYRIIIRAEDWPAGSLPAHLQPRIEVVDKSNRTVLSGRDLAEVQKHVRAADVRTDAWATVAKRWERRDVQRWDFGDLPETIHVEDVAGAPVLAYPGLRLHEGKVEVALYRSPMERERHSIPGIRRLAEMALATDLARVRKDLKALGRFLPVGGGKPVAIKIPVTVGLADAFNRVRIKPAPDAAGSTSEAVTTDSLEQAGCDHLAQQAFRLEPLLPLLQSRFVQMLETARRELPALTYRVCDLARQILDMRTRLLAAPEGYKDMARDIQRLTPPDFLARTPHAMLPHLLRYLRAIQIRAERASLQPAKDLEKARQLTPFENWTSWVPLDRQDQFRWMLEEFRVSLFAQELGTAQPASAQRLKALAGVKT